jgi:hypothetical protein
VPRIDLKAQQQLSDAVTFTFESLSEIFAGKYERSRHIRDLVIDAAYINDVPDCLLGFEGQEL